jgi:hypothetical protein
MPDVGHPCGHGFVELECQKILPIRRVKGSTNYLGKRLSELKDFAQQVREDFRVVGSYAVDA